MQVGSSDCSGHAPAAAPAAAAATDHQTCERCPPYRRLSRYRRRAHRGSWSWVNLMVMWAVVVVLVRLLGISKHHTEDSTAFPARLAGRRLLSASPFRDALHNNITTHSRSRSCSPTISWIKDYLGLGPTTSTRLDSKNPKPKQSTPQSLPSEPEATQLPSAEADAAEAAAAEAAEAAAFCIGVSSIASSGVVHLPSARHLQAVKQNNHKLYRSIREAVERRDVAIHGGMYVGNADLDDAPAEEGLVRLFTSGISNVYQLLHKRPESLTLESTKGFCGQVPQLMKKLGLKSCLLRHKTDLVQVNHDQNRQRDHQHHTYDNHNFTWTGLDGSRLDFQLTHQQQRQHQRQHQRHYQQHQRHQQQSEQSEQTVNSLVEQMNRTQLLATNTKRDTDTTQLLATNTKRDTDTTSDKPPSHSPPHQLQYNHEAPHAQTQEWHSEMYFPRSVSDGPSPLRVDDAGADVQGVDVQGADVRLDAAGDAPSPPLSSVASSVPYVNKMLVDRAAEKCEGLFASVEALLAWAYLRGMPAAYKGAERITQADLNWLWDGYLLGKDATANAHSDDLMVKLRLYDHISSQLKRLRHDLLRGLEPAILGQVKYSYTNPSPTWERRHQPWVNQTYENYYHDSDDWGGEETSSGEAHVLQKGRVNDEQPWDLGAKGKYVQKNDYGCKYLLERERKRKERARQRKKEKMAKMYPPTSASDSHATNIEDLKSEDDSLTTPLIAFNPLGWERVEIVEVGEDEDSIKSRCRSLRLREVHQKSYRGRQMAIFVLPSMGYTVGGGIQAHSASVPPAFFSRVRARKRRPPKSGFLLQNSVVAVMVNSDGSIHRVYDRSNRRYITEPDRANVWHQVTSDGKHQRLKAETVELVEKGPLRAALLCRYRVNGTLFNQLISLKANAEQVEFQVSFESVEAPEPELVVDFATTVSGGRFTPALCDTPFGHVVRETHRNSPAASAWQNSLAMRWLSLPEEYSIAVGLASSVRRKFSIPLPGVIRLHVTSPSDRAGGLRPAKLSGPTDLAPADKSLPSFKFGLLKHNREDVDELAKYAMELTRPPIITRASSRPTKHAFRSMSLVSVLQTNIIVDSVKLPDYAAPHRGQPPKKSAQLHLLSDEANDWNPPEYGEFIVRMHEVSGRRTRAFVKIDRTMLESNDVTKCDLLENQLQSTRKPKLELSAEALHVTVKFKPFEVVTLSVKFNPNRVALGLFENHAFETDDPVSASHASEALWITDERDTLSTSSIPDDLYRLNTKEREKKGLLDHAEKLVEMELDDDGADEVEEISILKPTKTGFQKRSVYESSSTEDPDGRKSTRFGDI